MTKYFKNRFRIPMLIFVWGILCSGMVLADESQEFFRTVLILYDSSDGVHEEVGDKFLYTHAATVLNYLGFRTYYHDITQGLPSPSDTQDCYGILTWFKDEAMHHPLDYLAWARGQIDQGKRFVILGNVGALVDRQTNKETPLYEVNRMLEPLGLRYEGNWTDNPLLIQMISKESSMVEFERSLDHEIEIYEQFRSLHPANSVYLTLERSDMEDGISALVVTTPTGALAADPYDIYIDYQTQKRFWRINPFRFFEEAFGLQGKPRLDTTTLFGQRLLYSHIDGDGFRNISEIGSNQYCGEIIYEQILKEYPLPITVSWITADVDPEYFGSETINRLARNIAALKTVEVGVHGFSHPLDWTRQLTAYAIPGYSQIALKKEEEELVGESHYGEAAIITLDQASYLKKEVVDATAYLNQYICPPEKSAVLYQWTGDCQPQEAALQLVSDLGIGNLNGGDSIFDRSHPSYTGLAPLMRSVGNRIQTYTSNANENIYTKGWTGPFYGYSYVLETFAQTEYPTLISAPPRRLSPMNVYYHFYIGEKEISLASLKEVYDYALAQDPVPIFTSHYVNIINDFWNARIAHRSDGGWTVRDYGQCRTLRWDHQALVPDLERSRGVLGYVRWENSLYVHLDHLPEAVIYFTNQASQAPYIMKATALLHQTKLTQDSFSCEVEGFRDSMITLANMEALSAYRLQIFKDPVAKTLYFEKQFKSSREGNLEIRFPASGMLYLNLKKV